MAPETSSFIIGALINLFHILYKEYFKTGWSKDGLIRPKKKGSLELSTTEPPISPRGCSMLRLEDVLKQRVSYMHRERFQTPSTHRNEQVRHLAFIFEPSLAVLLATPLNVAESTVANHASEEERVEPRERA
jgi:hypothetical protein